MNCLKEGETEPAWLPYKMMPAQMDVRWWCAARGVERIDQIRETVDDKFAEILDLLSIEKEDFEESNWLVFARIMVLSHKATLNLEKTDLRFNQVLPVLYSIYYEYNEVLDKNDKSLLAFNSKFSKHFFTLDADHFIKLNNNCVFADTLLYCNLLYPGQSQYAKKTDLKQFILRQTKEIFPEVRCRIFEII